MADLVITRRLGIRAPPVDGETTGRDDLSVIALVQPPLDE